MFEKNEASTEGAKQYTKRTLIHAQADDWKPENKVDITFKNDWVELIGPGALSAIDANGNTNVTFEEELAKDVITLMTVFCARLYGKRSNKNRVMRLT